MECIVNAKYQPSISLLSGWCSGGHIHYRDGVSSTHSSLISLLRVRPQNLYVQSPLPLERIMLLQFRLLLHHMCADDMLHLYNLAGRGRDDLDIPGDDGELDVT